MKVTLSLSIASIYVAGCTVHDSCRIDSAAFEPMAVCVSRVVSVEVSEPMHTKYKQAFPRIWMYLGFVRLQAERHCEIEDMLGSLMGVHCQHVPDARPPHRQVSQKLISLAPPALPK